MMIETMSYIHYIIIYYLTLIPLVWQKTTSNSYWLLMLLFVMQDIILVNETFDLIKAHHNFFMIGLLIALFASVSTDVDAL